LAGALGAAAAACLLAVLVWPGREDKDRIAAPSKSESLKSDIPRAAEDNLSAWREAERTLDGKEPPPFTWPLGETPPVTAFTAIPADLLD
jgi:hypothetical protein